MRPKQWPKNGFLFAGLIFDGQLLSTVPFARTLAGFVLFCLLSSAVYLLNDITDLEADRQHPKKKYRPIASGDLPVPAARVAIIVLLLTVLPLAYFLSTGFFVIAVFYLVINIAYSTWLKHIPILDVLILASLYVLRVGAGVELIKVAEFSPWLYVFTTFLALFLGVGKRRAELNLLPEYANMIRPVLGGYTLPFLDQLLMLVSTSTIMTYSLYTFSGNKLPGNHSMMLTIPFVIYGIFRYLYLVQVEHSGSAPEDVLLTDRPMQVTLVLFGLAILVIFYILPSYLS